MGLHIMHNIGMYVLYWCAYAGYVPEAHVSQVCSCNVSVGNVKKH